MPYLRGMMNAHTSMGTLINRATNCPPASETDSQLKKAWKTMAIQMLPLALLYNQVNTIVVKSIMMANIGKPRTPNST